MTASAQSPSRVLLPEAPILVARLSEALWVTPEGEATRLAPAAAAERARAGAPLLCHGRATARRLGIEPFRAYDLLELYAFVRPAAFCTPTPGGLATALGLAEPHGLEGAAAALRGAARALLSELGARSRKRDRDAPGIAWTMARAGWPWGPSVLAALGQPGLDAAARAAPGRTAPGQTGGLDVWTRLASWSDQAPPPPSGHEPVSAAEARARLAELLGAEAEARPQQADYASAVSQAFAPRAEAGAPNLVLAEAGTGVGKTLGYIAPASLWAEKNEAPVWLSTFTRNLQHQIDGELDRLYPTPKAKAEHVVIRKGRENYLCLLNFEESVRALGLRPGDAVAVGLMARWIGRTLGLTDRRGECIYSACQHYGKCFIERGIRRARHARIVVANHALVMIQAALGAAEEGHLPVRYVFDEGHHVFAAADNAFAAHLSGQEAQALRRWLLGAEARGRTTSRNRGLRRRVEDLIYGDKELTELIEEALRAARALPAEGWRQRLAEGGPQGPCEAFLASVRAQVGARADRPDSPYSLETEVHPAEPELLETAERLNVALARLTEPLTRFRRKLAKRLDEEADDLDSDARRRIEATCRGIERRATVQLGAWRAMLESLRAETPAEFVDWLELERIDGRDTDVGMYRHWVDPTAPFAETLLAQAHGVVVTSATLTDGSGDAEADWLGAEQRTGARHLPNAAIRAGVPSPFDYAALTRVLVIADVRKDDMDQVAAAYRELFLAARGGALGLFTAISRLRAVHGRIGTPLERAGLSLYAQHVDGMDTATLVDIFRAEEDSCLLGTDAVRDGVDVPGRSLRLIVFDRVPWPRPDIRHRVRRKAFGGRTYDDRITRLRLKQAYGRLVRRADDRGVFVLLDPMMPSRLAGAFPPGVEVQRMGLAEAVIETKDFLEGR